MINTKKGNAQTANLDPCKVPPPPQSATQLFLVSSRNAPPHKQFFQLVIIINKLFWLLLSIFVGNMIDARFL